MKRGQVAIFIIILLIITGFVVIAFLFRENIGLGVQEKVDDEVKLIDSAIENCIEQRAIDAIRLVGLQGGYVSLPEDYLETDLLSIAYGLYNGEKTLPTKLEIQNEINSYLELTLPFCINENNFPDFNIITGESSASSKIKQDSIVVKAKLPVAASRGEESFTIDREYETVVLIRFGSIHDVAEEIIEKQITEGDYVPLTFLLNFEQDVLFSYYDDNTLIYSITDSNSQLNNISYSFIFGADLR